MKTIGIQELADITGLSVRSIYRRRTYMKETLPPAVKVGGRLRWDVDTVNAWMSAHEEAQEGER